MVKMIPDKAVINDTISVNTAVFIIARAKKVLIQLALAIKVLHSNNIVY
jgi:hypothetical protein